MNHRIVPLLRLVLAGVVALPFWGRAQEVDGAIVERRDFLVQNWQLDQGLPRNNINAITQDPQGYLWFGTPHGLVRFDGVRFVALEAGISPALARGFVQKLLCDRAGNLWIATRRSGLLRFREGAITNADPAWPLPAADSVAEDAEGVIWATDGNGRLGRLADGKFVTTAQLGTIATGPMLFKLTTDVNGGLWFYKQDTFGRILNGQPTNHTKLPGRVITLAPARDGGMWVSTGDDLRRVSPGSPGTTHGVTRLNFGAYGITVLQEDRSGCLWIGTLREGLYRLRGTALEKIAGVHHQILDLLEDAEGNIWVATDGAGVFKVRPRSFEVAGEAEGSPPETVLSVSEDWVASRVRGVGRLGPSGAVEVLPGLQKIKSVATLLEDAADGVWLGTGDSRLIHSSGQGVVDATVVVGPAGTQIRALLRDRAGNLWLGGFPYGLFRLPVDDPTRPRNLEYGGFPRSEVTAIAEDGSGAIWIGTGTGELYCHTNGTFRRFSTAEGFTGFAIGALLPATNGILWVGTLGGGLGRFQDGRIRFLRPSQGLGEDVVSQLIEDDAGWLWMGGSRGISRVRPGDLEAVLEGRKERVASLYYGPSDGLANVQCTIGSQPSVWRTRAGWLRFATSQGVVSFDPATLPMNLRPPPLVMEEVLVDGGRLQHPGAVVLRHDFNKLEFRYTATSFVAPEKVRFRRRLLGFDEGWLEDETARSAVYPRLQPGKYVFQFTAANNDGVWNDEVFSLPFEVIPAFWQTVWFRAAGAVALAAAGGGGVFLVVRLRMRRKLARLEQANALERERTRISRDLHDDLGARLTQMALLTDLAGEDSGASADLKAQIRAVSQQARSAVQSLDETVWLMNPKKDTLVHLIGYTARYAEQFFQAAPVACRLDICRHPPDCSVPGNIRRDIFLLVKEALNNVLKHSGASEVWLKIAVRGPIMRIVIQDNGRGFALSAMNTQRHGFENMRRRAAGAGIKLVVRSRAGIGTRIALRVRLEVRGDAVDPASAAG